MIIIGDIHAKNREPYRKHIGSFFEWLLENYKYETIIILGDLFDTSSPHNEVEAEIIGYLVQFKNVIILSGNHDYSKRQGNTLLPMIHHENIKVITKPEIIEIGGNECMFLPFTYKEMKEQYENLEGDYNYIFTHATPTECAFGDEGIDFKLRGTYIHGHTHIQKDFTDKYANAHFVIGVPVPTRHLEDDQKHRIFEISEGKIKTIEVPIFLKYETITFGEEPQNKDWIYNVIEAPDISSVYEKYKDYYIRESGIEKKRTENNESVNFSVSEGSYKDLFIKFSEENDLSKEIHDRVLYYLDQL